MTAPNVVSRTDAAEVEAPTFPLSFATEAIRSFARAVKAQQLYLPNNPMHAKAAESLQLALNALWSQTDELTLEITETEFRAFDQEVYSEPEKTSESLPWTFYKDGIRELRITKGFEKHDMQQLLELLQRVRTSSPDDDDLLTLLWEQEFTSLEYKYVEAGGGGGDVAYEPIEAGEQLEQFEKPEQIADATPARLVSSAPAPGLVRMDDFDSTLYFLDENEIEYLRSGITKEFSSDLRPSVVAALLDTFEQQADVGVREEVARNLENMLIILLSTAQVRDVAFLLREVAAAAQRATALTEIQKQRFEQLPERLSEPAAFNQLLETLEVAPIYPGQTDMHELFALLRPAALETIFSYLSRTQNTELRTLLEGAADRIAITHTAELVRLILSPDPAVALEAIQRSAAMKTTAAVQALAQVVSEGLSQQMRLAAVLALADIGSPGALQALEKAVEDSDREIRIAATKALVGRAYRAALPRVERAIRGKALRESNLTEKLAFFEAFGTLAGDGGVDLLDQILNGKGPLGKREDAELRACAAAGLAKISSRRAREALQRAAAEKEVLIRNAVARALRGTAA